MNGQVIPLQAVPIFHSQSNFILTQEEKDLIYKENNSKLSENKKTTPLASKENCLLNKPDFSRIKIFFENTIKDYKENVLEITNDIYMTTSWFTINNKNDFHHKHAHPNTFLSMIYYVECESGNLIFYPKSSLQEGFNLEYDIKNFNVFNSTKWTINIKPNDIVIFPGWITHSTSPNLSDKKRIALVASFFLKGKFGSEYEELYLM